MEYDKLFDSLCSEYSDGQISDMVKKHRQKQKSKVKDLVPEKTIDQLAKTYHKITKELAGKEIVATANVPTDLCIMVTEDFGEILINAECECDVDMHDEKILSYCPEIKKKYETLVNKMDVLKEKIAKVAARYNHTDEQIWAKIYEAL